jgi:hypothetical protein
MNSKDYRNIREAYLDVYDNIMEKEDSEYEKASDAALDARYGYGRATGDKHSFGRAANRASAAASLRALRRGERSGSGTSREAVLLLLLLFVLLGEVKGVVVELREKQVLMQFIKDGQKLQKQVQTKLQRKKKEEQYLLILHIQIFLMMKKKKIEYLLMP